MRRFCDEFIVREIIEKKNLAQDRMRRHNHSLEGEASHAEYVKQSKSVDEWAKKYR